MATITKRVEYSDGDVYEGEWTAQGKREGVGQLKLVNGDSYCGEFINGFFHGLGVLTLANGSKYEGMFEHGRYHGHGIYSLTDKTKYEGQFHQGLVKGLGIITFPDGSNGQPRKEGKFQDLVLQERCNATTAIHKARQNAANARGIASQTSV